MHEATMIPHSRPSFEPAFFDGVKRVLLSRQVASASEVRALEAEVATLVQQTHAVAVDSGTSALMLAILALKTDCETFRVGIPAYACSAVFHAVRAAGATPVCMDCGVDLRLDRKKALSVAKQLDAVVLVHPFGFTEPLVWEDWPCPVIEDIAQSAGGALNGRPSGSFGDLTIASFYTTKPWGGAYGGMVLCQDEYRIQLIRSMSRADDADACSGYAGNHQMSDIHAVLARIRLEQAAKERRNRRQVACMFDDSLAASGWRSVARNEGDACYRYIVRRKDSAESAIRNFRLHHVYACRPVQKTISSMLGDDSCSGAEAAWRDCVSIPLLSNFTECEIQQVCKAMRACLP